MYRRLGSMVMALALGVGATSAAQAETVLDGSSEGAYFRIVAA